jgi:hypothetical protein
MFIRKSVTQNVLYCTLYKKIKYNLIISKASLGDTFANIWSSSLFTFSFEELDHRNCIS